MGINILIAGVGGQGTLLACRILGNLGIAAGYDVKTSEVHGMSQRGGSVVTHIKFADRVDSPLIEYGKADFILAFEPLEAIRYVDFLAADGCFIINSKQVPPVTVLSGDDRYPAEISADIKARFKNTIFADASDIALKCGSIKAVNVVLLGIMAAQKPGSGDTIPADMWRAAVKDMVPERFQKVNLAAFDAGLSFGERNRS